MWLQPGLPQHLCKGQRILSEVTDEGRGPRAPTGANWEESHYGGSSGAPPGWSGSSVSLAIVPVLPGREGRGHLYKYVLLLDETEWPGGFLLSACQWPSAQNTRANICYFSCTLFTCAAVAGVSLGFIPFILIRAFYSRLSSSPFPFLYFSLLSLISFFPTYQLEPCTRAPLPVPLVPTLNLEPACLPSRAWKASVLAASFQAMCEGQASASAWPGHVLRGLIRR